MNHVCNMQQTRGTRLLHIDLIKIIAIYLVMYIHTSTRGMYLWSIVSGLKTQVVYMLITEFARIAVPLFYMTSGAVLLGKEESIRDVLTKRVLKFVLIVLVVSSFYLGRPDLDTSYITNLWEYLGEVYSSSMYWHLWYLYSHVGLLLMLPLLRKLARNMSHEEYLYMALFYILFTGILPILEYFIGDNSYHLNSYVESGIFTSGSIVFFLMGYYIEHVMPSKYRNRRVLTGSVVLGILGIMITAAMVLYHGYRIGDLSENSSSAFSQRLVALPSFAVYLGAKMFFERFACPQWLCKGITWVGGTTFGIYLLEPFFRGMTDIVFLELSPVITSLPACIIWIFCALVLGIVIVSVLKKIPVLNKFI